MSSIWHHTLQQLGLSTTQPAMTPAPEQRWITPLCDQQLLRLHGPDAEKFLQGQVTCDLGQLSTERSLLGANCTPKGNVISVFRLLQREPHDLLLRLNGAIAPAALANLRKYSVFSKAELDDLSGSWAGIGIGGHDAAALLQTLLGSCPAAPGEQRVSAAGALLVQVAAQPSRYELWAPQAEVLALWQRLAEQAAVLPPSSWTAAEIAAGQVLLDGDSVDSYLPQMLNLQAIEGISFTKGCYTGQEVVARLHYRGKLKKRLYAAEVPAAAVAAGTLLHSATRASAGKVLAAVPRADGTTLLQAVINKGEADSGELRLGGSDGPQVRLLPLPYAIDAALFERD